MIKKTESSVLSKAGLIEVDQALESWHDADFDLATAVGKLKLGEWIFMINQIEQKPRATRP